MNPSGVEVNSSNHRHSSRVNQPIAASAPRKVPPYGIEFGTTSSQSGCRTSLMLAGLSLPQPAKAWASNSTFDVFTFPPLGGLSFAASLVAPPHIEVARQQSHAEERVHQLARSGQLDNAAPVGVDRADVDECPLGPEPVGKALLHHFVAEDQLARRPGGRTSRVEKTPGRPIEPAPVVDQALNLIRAADRTMPGDESLCPQVEQALERGYPGLEWPGPHDRGDPDEEYVGRDRDPLVGDPDDQVAGGVR